MGSRGYLLAVHLALPVQCTTPAPLAGGSVESHGWPHSLPPRVGGSDGHPGPGPGSFPPSPWPSSSTPSPGPGSSKSSPGPGPGSSPPSPWPGSRYTFTWSRSCSHPAPGTIASGSPSTSGPLQPGPWATPTSCSRNFFPWPTCQGFSTTGSNLHIQLTLCLPASFSPRPL